MARSTEARRPLAAIGIAIDDRANVRFVTDADIRHILADVYPGIDTMQRGHINTYRIVCALNHNNRIESATVNILNDGSMSVQVTPMIPVARVFPDSAATSYYVNAVGKRLPADPEHIVDVPVLCGDFADTAAVRRLLPMLATIHGNTEADALVASISIDRHTGDIILHPNVVGHVINMGDTSIVANKLARVRSFYHRVMPVKGWTYYDTVSVKWGGRVVATHRTKRLPASVLAMRLDSLAANDVQDYIDESVVMPPMPESASDNKDKTAKTIKDSSHIQTKHND